MIYTITPLVEVASVTTGIRALFAHGIGLLVGASSVMLFVSATGFALDVTMGPGFLIAALGALAVLSVLGKVPDVGWQVPRHWVDFGFGVGSFLYGLFLGVGFLTKAPYGVWLATLLLVMSRHSPTLALVAAVAYALGRWAPIAAAMLGHRIGRDYHDVAAWMISRSPKVRIVDVGLLLGVAASVSFR